MTDDNESPDSKELFLQLLRAETGEKVKEVLGRLEDQGCNVEWKDIGDSDNNSGTLEGQAGPSKALTEKIKNSNDANLRERVAEERGVENLTELDVDNSYEAAEIVGVDDKFTRVIARNGKTEPNVLIVDNGGGQPPGEFHNTFCDMHSGGSTKQQYSFAQGQYGVGGHAVLQHCGKNNQALEGHGAELIASRSHRHMEDGIEEFWGWTIKIRDPEREHTFIYLTFDGEIPRFSADEIEIEAETESFTIESGTVCKMFDYQFKAGVKSNPITHRAGVKAKLTKQLPEPVLPVEMIDVRDRYVNTAELPRLSNVDPSRPEVKAKYVDTVYVDHPQIDPLDARAYVFASTEEVRENDDMSETWYRQWGTDKRAVLLGVNGQTHATFGAGNFLNYHCGYEKINSNMLIYIDLSDLYWKTVRQTFNYARNRGDTGEEKFKAIRKAVKEYVSNHEGLRNEEARQTNAIEDDHSELRRDTIQDIAEHNPDLIESLEKGNLIRLPSDNDTDDDDDDDPEGSPSSEYDRQEPPTHLRRIERFKSLTEYDLWPPDDPDADADDTDKFTIATGEERRGQGRFELNAPNDHFDDHELTVDVADRAYDGDDIIASRKLTDGVLTLTIKPEDEIPGELPDKPVVITTPGKDGYVSTEFHLTSEEKPEPTTTVTQESGGSELQLGFGIRRRTDISRPVSVTDHDGITVGVNVTHDVVESILDDLGVEAPNPREHGENHPAADAVITRWVTYMALQAVQHLQHARESDVIDMPATAHAEEVCRGGTHSFRSWAFDKDELDRLTS